ncbi:MAG: alpha-acetolactate decarboxylase [Gammaproteobacteria bacterium RIFCSPHIGHO2_12_FULL_42_10]|nr:MAG: alpha-acetolactate decarboxylase [Gammaproteobacteria bacterium RIFCSPHIGHO2_12_FULL_42_10]
MPTLSQIGTITGLLQGINDGDTTVQQLKALGDIGLGTYNRIDGEMVILDGACYRIKKNGHAEIADPNQCTPFAVISPYQPTLSFTIDQVENSTDLNQKLDAQLKTKNIFYMIRIDAKIDWIKLRSEGCQSAPYQPLAEALSSTQSIYELTKTKGTLITTRCPSYSAGITIPGFHHHFINHDKTIGGHVFDVKCKHALVKVTLLRRFNMQLLNNQAFDTANLNIDSQVLLKKTE